MTHNTRIKRGGPRKLHFEVDDAAGRRIATSLSFETICRPESGLATLVEVSQSATSAAIEHDAHATSIGLQTRRGRVRFVRELPESKVRELLLGASTARVIDERPAAQRRGDLTGRRCDLGH